VLGVAEVFVELAPALGRPVVVGGFAIEDLGA
jgi:hypothetical protein